VKPILKTGLDHPDFIFPVYNLRDSANEQVGKKELDLVGLSLVLARKNEACDGRRFVYQISGACLSNLGPRSQRTCSKSSADVIDRIPDKTL
jgi:hypothetical protein